MQMNLTASRHYSHADKLLGCALFPRAKKHNNSYKSGTDIAYKYWYMGLAICCSGELIKKLLLFGFLSLLHKGTMQNSVLAMPVR